MNNTDPAAGYQTYDHPPVSDHSDHSPRHQTTAGRTALTICTIADTAAGLLGLWIVLCLLDANVFTMDTEGLRVVLNYGLPAVIYLLIGHGIAARINRA